MWDQFFWLVVQKSLKFRSGKPGYESTLHQQNLTIVLLISIITGLFIIGLGFVVQRNPNLIAGFNSLTSDDKEKVEVKALATFARNGLVIIGMVLIVISIIFRIFQLPNMADVMLIIVPIIGTIFLAMGIENFAKKSDL